MAESIESLLVPLLTQIPSPELYTVPTPSSNNTPNHTPRHTPHWAHNKRAILTKAILDAIDNCKDQLPSRMEGDHVTMEALKETIEKVMATCSQLTCSDDYLGYKKDKVHANY